MPIIKCRVVGGAGRRAVAVDISLGVANGAAAVGYLSRAVAALPGLRPLVRPMHVRSCGNPHWRVGECSAQPQRSDCGALCLRLLCDRLQAQQLPSVA